jgi:hypothetical protein
MGMYDSVIVKCPKCDEQHEFQSKGGECSLDVYTLEDCPNDVMSDINRHSPYKCDCGVSFSVDILTRKAVIDYSELPMSNKTQTSVDWFFDKIKSHFEHDGDLLETNTFTYAIAKRKEQEEMFNFAKICMCKFFGVSMDSDEITLAIDKYYTEIYGK